MIESFYAIRFISVAGWIDGWKRAVNTICLLKWHFGRSVVLLLIQFLVVSVNSWFNIQSTILTVFLPNL